MQSVSKSCPFRPLPSECQKQHGDNTAFVKVELQDLGSSHFSLVAGMARLRKTSEPNQVARLSSPSIWYESG
jgi:hypothetical protein